MTGIKNTECLTRRDNELEAAGVMEGKRGHSGETMMSRADSPGLCHM